MATLKFMKQASKVKLRCSTVLDSKIGNSWNLKEEVRFLKSILHMKRFGGGVSELAHKVKALEKENSELKRRLLPHDKIQFILEQNLTLKKQLDLLTFRQNLSGQKKAMSSQRLDYSPTDENKARHISPIKSQTPIVDLPNDGDSDLQTANLRLTLSEPPERVRLPPITLPEINHKGKSIESWGVHERADSEPNGTESFQDRWDPMSSISQKKIIKILGTISERNVSNSSVNFERVSAVQVKDSGYGPLTSRSALKSNSKPINKFKTEGLSDESSVGSTSNQRQYQGILDLIEEHAARKSKGNRLKSNSKLTASNRLDQASENTGPLKDKDLSPESRRSDISLRSPQTAKDILRQIQFFTSYKKKEIKSVVRATRSPTKTEPELEASKSASKIYFKFKPSRVVKLNFKNSQLSEHTMNPKASHKFSLHKYESSLNNIKMEMDRINFD